jgi:hypothetical protein
MKILFLARHFMYFRNYDAALRALAAKGHSIHLVVERQDRVGAGATIEALARDYPAITYDRLPEWDGGSQHGLVRQLRLGQDYLRYLEPFYRETPLLLERARARTPQAILAVADPPVIGGRWWRRRLFRVLQAMDRAVPPPALVTDYLRDHRPDVLLITPLVDLGSQQIDFLRAARELGIPTGLCVWSWDHLSSKAYLREHPERVFVWNDTQRREAIESHGVPADRIAVTGAQCFDHWFDRQPSRMRQTFLETLGLPPERLLVLYVCSALIQGSPPEPPFVRRWLEALRRSSHPRIATAAVLVRPHPSHIAPWEGMHLSDLGPVAVWGGNPIDAQGRADYFDSLYHADAVVGLNTSAFIEAGIVGREVLTILPPEYHGNQMGTIHFRYLVNIGRGLLHVSNDFDEHLRQLAAAMDRPFPADHPHRAFLEQFVRPHGLAQAATPVFVEAVEALRDCNATAAARSPLLGKALLTLVSRLAERSAFAELLLGPRDMESLERMRRAAERKAQRREAAAAERRRRLEERAAKAALEAQLRADKARRAEEARLAKAAKLAAHMETKRRAREEYRRIKAATQAEELRRKKWERRRKRIQKLWRRVTLSSMNRKSA